MNVKQMIETGRKPRLPSEVVAAAFGMKPDDFHRTRGTGREWCFGPPSDQRARHEQGRPLLWSTNDALRAGIVFDLTGKLRLRLPERKVLFDFLSDDFLQKALDGIAAGRSTFLVLIYAGQSYAVRLRVGGIGDLSKQAAFVLDLRYLVNRITAALIEEWNRHEATQATKRSAPRLVPSNWREPRSIEVEA